jgi:hypothetical protein
VFQNWCQWLTPIILTTQEVEVRIIMVRSQPWTNSSRNPMLKKLITKKIAGRVAQAERRSA